MRTFLTVNIAILISLMFAPHRGRGLLRFGSYAHGPFFIQPSHIDGKQLVLQTIFIAVVFVLIVNILSWRRKRDDRD
jgi:preprotein translocase subunit SecG